MKVSFVYRDRDRDRDSKEKEDRGVRERGSIGKEDKPR
jgi:hypothetical protein